MENNQLTVPTLTINSSDSAVFGVEAYANSASFFGAGFQLATIPGAGHFIPQQEPDVVVDVILDFFGQDLPD